MLQKISLAINAVLIAAVAWLYVEHFSTNGSATGANGTLEDSSIIEKDSSTLVAKDVNSKIAYFEMDSIIQSYKLMQEKSEMLQDTEKRLTQKLGAEQQAAQIRYNELMNKDRTYSTMAEMEADQKELEGLMANVQKLEESSRNDLMLLQQDVMVQIVKNLQDFLSEYNEVQDFDYIFSMQPDGQIWSGNPSLDVTNDVLNGLNANYDRQKAMIDDRKSEKGTE